MIHFYGPKDNWHGRLAFSGSYFGLEFTLHLFPRNPYLWGYKNHGDYKSLDLGFITSFCWSRSRPSTYFISGHLDLTEEEFNEHYVPQIKSALEEGASFVVGDARGADTMAQNFLSQVLGEDAYDRVTVFHMFDLPRNLAKFLSVQGGYRADFDRDYAMTESSDDDIAWVRPGREHSGTQMNLNRRKRTRRVL